MNNEKLNVLLFAFRYAVHRIPTQALAAIQSELVTNLHWLPDWILEQMERDIEWNFEVMAMRKEERGTVGLDDDCEFQRPFLEAVKMKYLVTWKSIAFPDMDLQTCVEAENADAAQVKAEAEAPNEFQDVYYVDYVKEGQ